MTTEDKDIECNRNNISDALLQFFLTCKDFRETLLSDIETPIDRKYLHMQKLPQRIADTYYSQLMTFRREVVKIINAKPKAFMSFFAEAVQKDSGMDEIVWRITGGRASKLVKKLSVFNNNRTQLAKYILEWYKNSRLNVTDANGSSDLITPATFIGFSGEYATEESFALCPETFEDGYGIFGTVLRSAW